MIKSETEVKKFLAEFGIKLEIWGIFFLNRDKNIEALKELGITPSTRKDIIKDIKDVDYVETLPTENIGDMWVFGKDIHEKAIYIKIAIGQPNNQTICISFHEAEHKIKYAFK